MSGYLDNNVWLDTSIQFPEHRIKTKKFLDACQYKIQFGLTSNKYDQTLTETFAVALHTYVRMSDLTESCHIPNFYHPTVAS